MTPAPRLPHLETRSRKFCRSASSTAAWALMNRALKTISVSFEEKSAVEFPSIAICDSRAFRKLVPWTANAGRYNATTFNLEGQVSLDTFNSNNFTNILNTFNSNNFTDDLNTYTTELLPTIFNGYCMLYEFHRNYPANAWACKFQKLWGIIDFLTVFFSSYFSGFDACKHII